MTEKILVASGDSWTAIPIWGIPGRYVQIPFAAGTQKGYAKIWLPDRKLFRVRLYRANSRRWNKTDSFCSPDELIAIGPAATMLKREALGLMLPPPLNKSKWRKVFKKPKDGDPGPQLLADMFDPKKLKR
jgi:hypothetical protein